MFTLLIGCVIGGAFHGYMSGMISMRNDGAQMPSLERKEKTGVQNIKKCIFFSIVF